MTQEEKVEPVELVIEEEHEIKTSAGKFVVQRGRICFHGYEDIADVAYDECVRVRRVIGPIGFKYTELDLEKDNKGKPKLPELLKDFDLSETEIEEIHEAFTNKKGKK